MSRVGKSASRVESKYFFSVSVSVLSVCYPTCTFSTLLVYLAPKSSGQGCDLAPFVGDLRQSGKLPEIKPSLVIFNFSYKVFSIL